jgi:hypothetical protein
MKKQCSGAIVMAKRTNGPKSDRVAWSFVDYVKLINYSEACSAADAAP